eukprot:UN02224
MQYCFDEDDCKFSFTSLQHQDASFTTAAMRPEFLPSSGTTVEIIRGEPVRRDSLNDRGRRLKCDLLPDQENMR